MASGHAVELPAADRGRESRNWILGRYAWKRAFEREAPAASVESQQACAFGISEKTVKNGVNQQRYLSRRID